MQKPIFIPFLAVFFIIVATANAYPYFGEILISPQLVWKDSKIDIQIECYSNSSNETTSAWIQISSPIIKKVELEKVNLKFKGEYSTFPSLGNYVGYVFCKDTNSTINSSISFTVRDLIVNLIGITPSVIYPDVDWRIEIEVKEVGNQEKIISQNVTFNLFANEKPISTDYYFDVSKSKWILIPQKLQQGDYEIKILTSYEGITREVRASIKVNPILSILLISINKEVLSNQELTIGLKGYYKGNLTSLKLMQISVTLDNSPVEIKEIGDESIKILLPEKEAGSYELKINFNYRGYATQVSTIIDYVLPVTGKIVNPEGKPISGRLTFSKQNYVKQITVNGPYSGFVPKGTYRVEFLTPTLRLVLNSVRIDKEWNDLLKVDEFGKAVNLPGLKVAGGASIEFAGSFENGEVEIFYDSRMIVNEKLIKVYKCENWNFQARTCAGSWEEITADIDTIRDVVKFGISHLSAFVVGEMSSLQIVAALDKNQYFLNEPITVNGVVRDDEGNVVADANISYDFAETKGEVFSNKDGIFTFSLISPSKSGKYTLTLIASKANYLPATLTKDIEVVAKKDLAIVFGLQQSIEAGKNQTLKIKIINSGQTDLHNLKISISGLPTEWFDFEPRRYAVLKPGEELQVILSIYAPQQLEPKSYVVKVDATSDEVEKSDSFVLILQPPLQQKAEEGKAPSAPTGFFVLLQQFVKEKLTFIAIGVVSFLIVLILFLKFRGGKKSYSGRELGRSITIKRIGRL
jgi:hypothetical protein